MQLAIISHSLHVSKPTSGCRAKTNHLAPTLLTKKTMVGEKMVEFKIVPKRVKKGRKMEAHFVHST